MSSEGTAGGKWLFVCLMMGGGGHNVFFPIYLVKAPQTRKVLEFCSEQNERTLVSGFLLESLWNALEKSVKLMSI